MIKKWKGAGKREVKKMKGKKVEEKYEEGKMIRMDYVNKE